MTQRDVRAYLIDIEQACTMLELFKQKKSLADYLDDPMLRSAVERQFEIVGEALNRAISVDPRVAERVTEAANIVAFRNRLIHGYSTASDEVVWGGWRAGCHCSIARFRHFFPLWRRVAI